MKNITDLLLTLKAQQKGKTHEFVFDFNFTFNFIPFRSVIS